MATSSSNLVCVQIKLKNETDPLRPVVRKRTRGHEVVEIPGQNFMFTRRRKQPPAPPADAERAEDQAPSAMNEAAAAAAAVLETDAANADQGPEGPAAAAPADADTLAGDAAAPSAAAELSAAPTAFSTQTNELLEIVRWAVFNELQQQQQQQPAVPPAPAASSDPEQMVAVAEGVASRLAEQLGGSSGEGAGGAGPQCLMVLPHQVERLKASLLEKRDMLLQEEAAWLRLRDAYTASQGGPPAAAGGEEEAAAGGAEEEEEVEQQGLGEIIMEDAPVAAAAAGAQAEGAEVEAPGQQQQQQVLEEVAGGGPTVIPESPSPAPAAGEGTQGAAAAGGGVRGVGVGPVCAARGVALTRVGLQVESLVGLVAKVEQLVTAAEEASRDLQVTFHRERFQVFPHVNSPALLIKTIINPSQTSGP